ncbi:MAG: anthranilate phosphoribosyltransferase, partial [Gammaproteobacteria bacterium]
MYIQDAISQLSQQQNLNAHTCEQIVDEIARNEASDIQIAAFLSLLHAKTETSDELLGMVQGLRKYIIPVKTQHKLLDLVGTGGDRSNTVNISTGSAILAAACGVKVAKHGSRAVSSLAGSADVLEALGIMIDLTPEQISNSIDQIGIGFCHAPQFNPVMLQLRPVRRALGFPTCLNLLGPLLNPASADNYVLGVYNKSCMMKIAEVLQKLSTKRSVIVHGAGLDELSCIGAATIIEIANDQLEVSTFNPYEHGVPLCTVTDLQGGDALTNANILITAFKGKKSAISDTLIINAAMAMFIYELHA